MNSYTRESLHQFLQQISETIDSLSDSDIDAIASDLNLTLQPDIPVGSFFTATHTHLNQPVIGVRVSGPNVIGQSTYRTLGTEGGTDMYTDLGSFTNIVVLESYEVERANEWRTI